MIIDIDKTNWNACKAGGGQGLIIDEDTGRNIAVTYERSDAFEITRRCNAFPELLRALEAILDLPIDDSGERVIPAGFLDEAREAINTYTHS